MCYFAKKDIIMSALHDFPLYKRVGGVLFVKYLLIQDGDPYILFHFFAKHTLEYSCKKNEKILSAGIFLKQGNVSYLPCRSSINACSA